MKHILITFFWLLLLGKMAASGHLPPPDTVKTGLAAPQQSPAVDELKLALIDLHQSNKNGNTGEALTACLKIGGLYERVGHFAKAIEYYQRAGVMALQNMDTNAEQLAQIQWLIANARFQHGQFQSAYDGFSGIFEHQKDKGSYESNVQTLKLMAESALQLKDFSLANRHYQAILALAESQHDQQTAATAWNNIGYVANQMGQFKEAVSAFQQSETIAKSGKAPLPDYLYTNLGIALNNLGKPVQSVVYLKVAEKEGSPKTDKSYVQHLVSCLYLKNKDVYNALKYNELAINSAQKTTNPQVLCDAYDIASQLYTQLYEYDKALDFYKKHLTLKDSILRGESQRKLDLENLHNLLEQTEAEAVKGFTDEELRKLTFEQFEANNRRLQLEADNQRLDADRREKEIALLRREQEVKEANLRSTQLEAERNRQALRLATQQYFAEKQQREIASLSQQAKLDSLEAARQQSEQAQQIAQLENQKKLAGMELERQAEFKKNAYRLGLLGGAIFLLIFGGLLYGRRLNRQLALEQKRAEGLLLNILPVGVAAELKTKGAATPRHFPSATVLFTDFQGFTKISANMQPTEVLSELNECFLEFDRIIEKHGLEKIKTIGDSYMCAGGLPAENLTHPTDAVAAAKELRDFVERRNREKMESGKAPWPLRIGLHTGEVVAGVVGSKKFAYDIWGDTVNVASRMESNCPPGEINISATTYALVKHLYRCEYRGQVEVKNKGEMGMYLVKP